MTSDNRLAELYCTSETATSGNKSIGITDASSPCIQSNNLYTTTEHHALSTLDAGEQDRTLATLQYDTEKAIVCRRFILYKSGGRKQ